MKSKFLSVVALSIVATFASLLFASTASHAEEIPILTWESGKEQNIVLGGQTNQSHWDIFLVDATGKSAEPFARSAANSKGFIVYSLNLPTNLTPGSYHIEAKGKGGVDKVVAGVEVVPLTHYIITQIPTDLRLLVILFALFTATFAVIRGRRYSYLAFARHARFKNREAEIEPESKPDVFWLLQPLYTFRLRRQLGMEMSFLKFVTLRDSEVLHKASPNLWAVLPFASFMLATYEAVMMQGRHAIPHMNLAFYLIFVLIGAIDAVSGFSAAVAFFIAQILFVDISSARSVLIDVFFTAAWYAPSLLASIYYMTLKIDFFEYAKRLSSTIKIALTVALSALLGGAFALFMTVLLQSVLINQFIPSFFRWHLAAIVSLAICGKNILNELIDLRLIKKSSKVKVEVESIYVARVMSPTFATLIYIGAVGIIYVWTQQLLNSLLASLVIAIPYLLLFVRFPEIAGRRFPIFRRNIAIEALTTGAIAGIVFFGVEKLPIEVIQKSKTFILLGIVPVVIHAIYSVLVDSSERAAHAKEAADA